jgi:hypothetical protein
VCAGISLFVENNMIALRIVILAQTVLFFALTYFFVRTAQLAGARYWQPGLAVLAVYFLVTGLYASEAHLNGLTLVAGLYYLLRAVAEDRRALWVGAGVVLGLSVLARLDNIFVVGSLLIVAASTTENAAVRPVARRLIAGGLPLGLVLLPYLVLNLLSFGHLMPISGAIKSTFPIPTPGLDHLGDLGIVTAVLATLSLALSSFRSTPALWRVLLRGLGAGVLLHASYIVLFTHHYTFLRWYYVSGVVNAAFLMIALLQIARGRLAAFRVRWAPSAVTWLATVLLVAAGAAYGWAKGLSPYAPELWGLARPVNEYRWPDEVAKWMKSNLPPGSGVLAYDFPGALAFHSGLRVLPADGLVNDFRYNSDILKLGIVDYLCRHGVGYFFGPILRGAEPPGSRGDLYAGEVYGWWKRLRGRDGVQRVMIYAPLYREPAGVVELAQKHMVVRVRDVVGRPERTPELAIWWLGEACRP